MTRSAVASPTGHELRRYQSFNFRGGLDIKTSPVMLANLPNNNRLTVATNLVYNQDGSVSKRWGMRTVCKTATIADGICGGVQYRKSDGTVKNIVATDTDVYNCTSTSAATSLKSGLTNTTFRPSFFAVYNDVLVFTNSTDAAQQYDGTTWSALGGSSPTGEVVVAHANRLFMTTHNTSDLYWCKLNNLTDWSGTSDAGTLVVNKNDGAILKALVPSIQELAILKENRPYRLQGIGPATGYTVADSLTPGTGSVGACSTRAATFAYNNVWYVSEVGVHKLATTQNFGDLEESFISARIEPYFRRNTAYSLLLNPDAIQGIGFDHFLDPQIIADPYGQALYVGASIASAPASGFNRILYYDVAFNAWSQWLQGTGVGPPSSFWIARQTQPELFFSAGNTVYAYDRTATSDINTAAASVGISGIAAHVSNLGMPGVQKSPRYLYLYFGEESTSTTMTLEITYDFADAPQVSTTFDIHSAAAEGQIVKRVDLGGNLCEFMEVKVSNATAGKSFTWYGYEVDYRVRRFLRRAE